ncbi:MAG: acyltransferase [Candidatus Omnitrophica bacterium]|nr:acyltransferase [Candidatus Omnitrophota bacterium]
MWGAGDIEIGDNTIIAAHAIITSQTHDTKAYLYKDTQVWQTVKIGERVWIGTGAIILPGITIGDGAIIGAGSVVTHDVEKDSIVAGVPAQLLRYKEK